jgi:6-phosphogluconolactonase (cycloisomerase 2 family)
LYCELAINTTMAAPYTFLAGGYVPSISTVSFNPTTHALKVIANSPFAPTNPAWVSTHPHNRKLVLATAASPEGQLAIVSFDDKANTAHVVSNATSSGARPAHAAFSKDGKQVFIVNVRRRNTHT